MKTLELGSAKMPALGYGTWQLSGRNCVQAVRMALDIGYRHIDTAQIYDNEAEVGEAIAGAKVPREQLFVTTKVWTTNFERSLVKSSFEQSLKKLRMEYVDLLLMHWPNPEVPMAETLGALMEVQHAVKAKAIGVSNFTVALMKEAVEKVKAPIACNQVEYHVQLSQAPVIDYARKNKIAVVAYSPLARGKLAQEPVLMKIGEKYGKSANQVALRWLVQQDGVAAIPKAGSENHARANFEIFDFTLDDADVKAIAGIAKNQRLVNPGWAPQWDAA